MRAQEGHSPQTDQAEIMHILVEYWSSLFQYRPVTSSAMARMLSCRSWPLLTRDITLEELAQALKKPKNGSSPGPDGIPYEFYRAYPEILPKVVSLLNKCYRGAIIPPSWRNAILHLLPKEDKDLTLVTSYRPIALLCTDYKLLASILAERLQKEFKHKGYFPSHQSGFIRGRSIYKPIIRVSSWAATGKPVCLLDFEKAYDRVQHQWLYDCLRAAGFPGMFINFLSALLGEATMQIVANGVLSPKFPVTSGVR